MQTHNTHSIAANAVANLTGNLFNRLIPLVLVPIQIRLLGEEAFGLLGFYAALTAIFAFVDLGLTITANREIARARLETVTNSEGLNIPDLIRTFEIPYWIAGGLMGLAVLFMSDWFADKWIQADQLSYQTVQFSVAIMGLVFAVRWPVSLYVGILQGLERQVEINVFSVVLSVTNGTGSLLVLIISLDVRLFFVWQLFAGMIEIIGYVFLVWRFTRSFRTRRARFRWSIVRSVWRYALGINVMTIIGVTLGQSDRLFVSNRLPIENLGYFTVAISTINLMGILTGAIIPATTPRFVVDLSTKNYSAVVKLYHTQTRLITFLATGIAYAVAFFSYQVLVLWTQSTAFAEKAELTLMLISLGVPLEAASNTSNQVSLASGVTRFSIGVRTLSGIFQAVGSFLLIPYLGVEGAGFSWLCSRLVMYLAWPVLMHRQLLKQEQAKWLMRDTLPYFVVAALCYVGPHFLINMTDNIIIWIIIMAGSFLLYIFAILLLGLADVSWGNIVFSRFRRRKYSV